MKRQLAKTLMTLLIFTAGGSLLTATTAHAADACYNSPGHTTCDGDNPISSGCSADKYTITYEVLTDGFEVFGKVALLASPHCHTKWSATTNDYYCGPACTIRAKIYSCQNWPNYLATLNTTVPITLYSPMLFNEPGLESSWAWGDWTATDGSHAAAGTHCFY